MQRNPQPISARFTPMVSVALICWLLCTKAIAGQTFKTATIDSSIRNPITHLFAIAEPTYLPRDPNTKHGVSLTSHLTNYLSLNEKQSEVLLIDGETLAHELLTSYRVDDKWSVQLTLTSKKNSGGFTDNFIYRFHDVLALPQNGRTEQGRNRFRIFYQKDGESLINQSTSTSGLGDSKLRVQWQPNENGHLQTTFQVDIPTGKLDELSGNEKWDVGAAIIHMNPDWLVNRNWLPSWRLAFWYGAGLSLVGEAKELHNIKQNRTIASLRVGAGWQVFSNWTIKTQIDSNSPFFDSETRELGWFPLQFTIGSEHGFGQQKQWTFSWYLAEDMRPRSAPDVTLASSLEYRF